MTQGFGSFREFYPFYLAEHANRTERQIARGQALGHADEIGHDAPVVDREPAARAAEAGHHLVGDQQDPVGAHDRLEEHRRDRVGALVPDDVLEAVERLVDRPRFLLAPAVRVRVPDHAHEARLVRQAAVVAGQGHRPGGRAVVGAIPGEQLVTPRVVARELDRVLDRFRAA